jgi:hypothetical protein
MLFDVALFWSAANAVNPYMAQVHDDDTSSPDSAAADNYLNVMLEKKFAIRTLPPSHMPTASPTQLRDYSFAFNDTLKRENLRLETYIKRLENGGWRSTRWPPAGTFRGEASWDLEKQQFNDAPKNLAIHFHDGAEQWENIKCVSTSAIVSSNWCEASCKRDCHAGLCCPANWCFCREKQEVLLPRLPSKSRVELQSKSADLSKFLDKWKAEHGRPDDETAKLYGRIKGLMDALGEATTTAVPTPAPTVHMKIVSGPHIYKLTDTGVTLVHPPDFEDALSNLGG